MSQQPHTETICEETSPSSSPSPVPLPPQRDENDRTMAVESKEAGWVVPPTPGCLHPWAPKPVRAQDPRPTSGSADTPHHHQVTRSSIQDAHVKTGVCFKCKCSFQTRAWNEIHRLGCRKSCCNQHGGLGIFLNLCFHFFG